MKTITTQLDHYTRAPLLHSAFDRACAHSPAVSTRALIHARLYQATGVWPGDLAAYLDERDKSVMPGHAHPEPRCDTTPIEMDTDAGDPAQGIVVALVIELLVAAAIGVALAGWLARAAGWIG